MCMHAYVCVCACMCVHVCLHVKHIIYVLVSYIGMNQGDSLFLFFNYIVLSSV